MQSLVNYVTLRINKALANFLKSDSNNTKVKNNGHSAWEILSGGAGSKVCQRGRTMVLG